MKKTLLQIILPGALLLAAANFFAGCSNNGQKGTPAAEAPVADSNNAGLKLPQGFAALVVADSLKGARHLAVTKEGDIYVKLANLKDGNGIEWLHPGPNGKVAEMKGFSNYTGTGMYVKDGYLYASSDEEVFRYKLDSAGKVIDGNSPEKIVTGLLSRHEHEAKAITLDDNGNVYVNIGAYSNACQVQDRQKGSPGMKPCPILDSAGGIWQFKASGQNQTYGDGVRYATGLRNVVGLDWNRDINTLFVMQHGRDQLHDLFPSIWTDQQSAELPAECMYEIHKGDDCGWPYIFYDEFQHKKILGPEYGGDGKKTAGEKAIDPVVAFPGHMAPDGLLFYRGTMFPEKYRHGAFIAFHGSWNRAPEPQKGYFVVFVPFKDGKPSGDWEIFADGFSGTDKVVSPDDAKHRPCGLAEGPDGSIYVSDDQGGTIYRIMYNGK
ncbi:MAG TPA: PQQ-dependent sugar dehydrogenase [Chitinophagaceae bacterium]|nr:PQQ-dependent sugar dehydrogenase [Chitinophagaceae bacterium]